MNIFFFTVLIFPCNWWKISPKMTKFQPQFFVSELRYSSWLFVIYFCVEHSSWIALKDSFKYELGEREVNKNKTKTTTTTNKKKKKPTTKQIKTNQNKQIMHFTVVLQEEKSFETNSQFYLTWSDQVPWFCIQHTVMRSSKMSLKSKNMIFGFWHFLLGYCLGINLVKTPQRLGHYSKDTNSWRIEQTIRNQRNYRLCLAVS